MSKLPRKTLKEYAADAAARLKKSKNGTTQQKSDEKKSSKPVRKGE
jgi:hypothetical protein